jgi:hypothetical protein
MFHRRSREFDPRISAIAGHLRAIEKELGGIGNSAAAALPLARRRLSIKLPKRSALS